MVLLLSRFGKQRHLGGWSRFSLNNHVQKKNAQESLETALFSSKWHYFSTTPGTVLAPPLELFAYQKVSKRLHFIQCGSILAPLWQVVPFQYHPQHHFKLVFSQKAPCHKVELFWTFIQTKTGPSLKVVTKQSHRWSRVTHHETAPGVHPFWLHFFSQWISPV